MSAVAQRGSSSPATFRSQSVGRRPAGRGTRIRPWLPATPGPAARRSACRRSRQSAGGTTSSSRNATHGARAARQPTLRAAAGPRPPEASTSIRADSPAGAAARSPSRSGTPRSSTRISARGGRPDPASSAASSRASDGRPVVGTITSYVRSDAAALRASKQAPPRVWGWTRSEEAAGFWAGLRRAAALPEKRFWANRPASGGAVACRAPREPAEGAGMTEFGAGARERVLAAVPELDDLLLGGRPGEQVQSQPLSMGESEAAWTLWFILQSDCLVIAVPVAGLRPDASDDAAVRCNAYNGGMRWTVLSVAPWEGDQVATLSARFPLPAEDEGRWEAIGSAMEAVLRDAAPARSVFEGLEQPAD